MDQLTKYIVFHLKDEEYGVNIHKIRSIERLQHITRVPNTPDFIKGVMNLRGEITPVIDLKERLNISETDYTNQTRVLIVRINQIQVGLIVDTANEVVDIDDAVIQPAPEIIGSVNKEYIKGVANLEKRLLVILDLEQVLNYEEINEIKDVKAG